VVSGTVENSSTVDSNGRGSLVFVEPHCVDADPSWSSTVADVVQRLPASAPRFVACAPGVINLMGGLAELGGGISLDVTVQNVVCVAAQKRTDGRISIGCVDPANTNGSMPLVAACEELRNGRHFGNGLGKSAEKRPAQQSEVVDAAMSTLAELIRAGIMRDQEGVSLQIRSSSDDQGAVRWPSSTAASVSVAAAAAVGRSLDAAAGSALLASFAKYPGCEPSSGPALRTCAFLADAQTVCCADATTGALEAKVKLPKDITVSGADCGVAPMNLAKKLEQARAATFIGRILTDRILRHVGLMDDSWDGRLAGVSVADYVEYVRDRIPTRLKGSEFLARFGPAEDGTTVIVPSTLYKVRSRTEHHIYEEHRSRQFIQCLSSAVRPLPLNDLIDCGEAWYASHWSYGQRCGLGAIEADSLGNFLREEGVEQGIYGAKITGYGCGGLLAILHRDSEGAFQAIERALDVYRARTGRNARLIRGSAPGALVRGAQPM